MDPTAQFYARPSYVGGINFPVYTGSRRQTGGSVFGAIKRAVVPTLKSAGKEMGKQTLGLRKESDNEQPHSFSINPRSVY